MSSIPFVKLEAVVALFCTWSRRNIFLRWPFTVLPAIPILFRVFKLEPDADHEGRGASAHTFLTQLRPPAGTLYVCCQHNQSSMETVRRQGHPVLSEKAGLV